MQNDFQTLVNLYNYYSEMMFEYLHEGNMMYSKMYSLLRTYVRKAIRDMCEEED